jgi:hypothetical protein
MGKSQIGPMLLDDGESLSRSRSRVNGYQDTAGAETLLEVLRVALWHSHVDQCAQEPTSGCADSCSRQRGGKDPAYHDWTHARNEQGAE